MAELHHERGGFLVDQGAVAAGQVQQQHAGHAPIMPGVVVPPQLCRVLALAARSGLAEITRRDGAAPAVPGLAALLADLAASGTAPSRSPRVSLDAVTRWVTVAEAAALAGVSGRRIQQLAATGRLIARRHGRRAWLIDAASAAEWKARRT